VGSLDQDLVAAICSGAPPFHRLRHPAFRATRRAGRSERHTALEWLQIACVGPDDTDNLAAAISLDPDTFAQAFTPARLLSDAAPPSWAQHLLMLVELMPKLDREHAHASDPSASLACVLTEPARSLLNWERANIRHLFDEATLQDLSRQLATRILLLSWAVLELETASQENKVWDMGCDAWRQRLTGFTGLTYPMGTAIRQWRQGTLEILTRLQHDLPEVRERLFNGRLLGQVVGIAGDLGDRHDDGRSVAIVTFASGDRIVYKPKDLRCALFMMNFYQHVNNLLHSRYKLPTRIVLQKQNYAWEEFVSERTATSQLETERFFESFGRIIRLLQLLEARDFWMDNLLIRGESPDFADLECVLHPRLKSTQDLKDPDAAAFYEESVTPTAAVSHTIEVSGIGLQDFGALSGPGPRHLPVGSWDSYTDRSDGAFRLENGSLIWEPITHWPRIDGRHAETVNFVDTIEFGYRDMQRILTARAGELQRSCQALLVDGINFPVRVLMRNTWEYMVLLRVSLHPTAALDGNSREVALAQVVRTAPAWINTQRPVDQFRICLAEVGSIRSLDIPQFHNLPSDATLLLPSGDTVTDVFDGASLGRFMGRVNTIEKFDIDAHARILKEQIATIAGQSRTFPPTPDRQH
jgi:hypothetical protein